MPEYDAQELMTINAARELREQVDAMASLSLTREEYDWFRWAQLPKSPQLLAW